MTGAARLSLFAVLLVAVFAGAALLGGAVDPSGSEADDGHAEPESDSVDGGHAGEAQGGEHGSDGDASESALPGLAVAQDGYRLVVERTVFTRGARRQRLDFRVVDADGHTVRDFEVAHEKKMHFIVVRRDLEGFQHLHPTMRGAGTWTERVQLARGGTYRVFADFERDGSQHTLGADVQVAGDFRPAPLPRPERTVRSDGGLEVTLHAGAVRAGGEGRVEFEVRDGGRPVNDELEPYLGAKGHLVALRQGDLAYLHTHPEGDVLAFMATYPSAGAYRLFVQFSYDGRVHTAAFTRQVAQ